MTHIEKTISSERIYEGTVVNLRKDLVSVKDGKTSYREIVEHRGAVAVIPVLEDGRVPMVRQYRKAAEAVVLEVPAGKMEEGEEPAVTAGRELKEETGYTAEHMKHLVSFYTSIGFSNEIIHLYLATGLTPGDTDFDDNECIDMELYTLPELKEMVMRGDIVDGKTITAILLAESEMGR